MSCHRLRSLRSVTFALVLAYFTWFDDYRPVSFTAECKGAGLHRGTPCKDWHVLHRFGLRVARRQTQWMCLCGRCTQKFKYRQNALDPGREEVHAEFSGQGDELLKFPLESGGTLKVTRHMASEQDLPADAPPGSFQEWRVMRFLKPGEGTSYLFQSVTKVTVSPSDGGISCVQADPEVLVLDYTKSIVAVLLAALQAMGSPVTTSLDSVDANESEPIKILAIGLGGGSIPSFLVKCLPNCVVDVAELEDVVFTAASEGMGFCASTRLHVEIADGVVFADKAVTMKHQKTGSTRDGPYDAVIIDANDIDCKVPGDLWRSDGGLAAVLTRGLLRARGGVVITNFQAEMDLAEPIDAFQRVLLPKGPLRTISVQAFSEYGSLMERLFDALTTGEIVIEDQGPGNHIVAHVVGSADLASSSTNDVRNVLEQSAAEVGKALSAKFSLSELVGRGFRDWPVAS